MPLSQAEATFPSLGSSNRSSSAGPAGQPPPAAEAAPRLQYAARPPMDLPLRAPRPERLLARQFFPEEFEEDDAAAATAQRSLQPAHAVPSGCAARLCNIVCSF